MTSPPTKPGWLNHWLQLSRQIRQLLGERYVSAGLNESRAAVLEALAQHGQPVTQTELAMELCLSESALCGLVERMRQEQLLTRERSTLDRRKTLLALTVTGREQWSRVQSLHADLEQKLQVGVSEEALRVLLHFSRTVEANRGDTILLQTGRAA